MATTTPSAQEQAFLHPDMLFQQLEDYTWSTDNEFQSGLQAILRSNPSSSPEQAELLTLRARCFYFSRKNDVSIDFDAYQEWRKRHLSSSQPANDSSSPTSGYTSSITRQNDESSEQNGSGNDASVPSTSAENVAIEARYPTSFSRIVELITSGQPVPGIKDVPDTLLSGQDSPAVILRRKKPWEQGERVGSSSIPFENRTLS